MNGSLKSTLVCCFSFSLDQAAVPQTFFQMGTKQWESLWRWHMGDDTQPTENKTIYVRCEAYQKCQLFTG